MKVWIELRDQERSRSYDITNSADIIDLLIEIKELSKEDDEFRD